MPAYIPPVRLRACTIEQPPPVADLLYDDFENGDPGEVQFGAMTDEFKGYIALDEIVTLCVALIFGERLELGRLPWRAARLDHPIDDITPRIHNPADLWCARGTFPRQDDR